MLPLWALYEFNKYLIAVDIYNIYIFTASVSMIYRPLQIYTDTVQYNQHSQVRFIVKFTTLHFTCAVMILLFMSLLSTLNGGT